MKPLEIDPSADPRADPLAGATHGVDADLALLSRAAAALRRAGVAQRTERMPLERVELELARVMRIELARLLARAHALLSSHLAAQEDSVRRLQRDAAETIAVARTCGVPVPRVVRRLLAGEPATWPAPERLARWAAALDPDAAASR
jgi:hypothetical protein